MKRVMMRWCLTNLAVCGVFVLSACDKNSETPDKNATKMSNAKLESSEFAIPYPNDAMSCDAAGAKAVSDWTVAWLDYRGRSATTAMNLATLDEGKGVERVEPSLPTITHLFLKPGEVKVDAYQTQFKRSEALPGGTHQDLIAQLRAEKTRYRKRNEGPNAMAYAPGFVIDADATVSDLGWLFAHLTDTELLGASAPKITLYFKSAPKSPEGVEPVPDRIREQFKELDALQFGDAFDPSSRALPRVAKFSDYTRETIGQCDDLIAFVKKNKLGSRADARVYAQKLGEVWVECECNFDVGFLAARTVAFDAHPDAPKLDVVTSLELTYTELPVPSFLFESQLKEDYKPPTPKEVEDAFRKSGKLDDTEILILERDALEANAPDGKKRWADIATRIAANPERAFCLGPMLDRSNQKAALYCTRQVYQRSSSDDFHRK